MLSSDTVLKSWIEIEGGTVGVTDGANITFTLAYVPDPIRTMVFLNGLMQRKGVAYTISGKTITFATPPAPGDTLDVVAYGRFNV